jgi:hypothetical protein
VSKRTLDETGRDEEKVSQQDWVVQNIVPAREGVDERRFTTVSTGYVEDWHPVKATWSAGLMHGDIKCGQRIEVRCLRRDFPYSSQPQPTGIEAIVCADIARRQQLGVAKYGVTVADNPLALREWLEHAYQESLDQAVYLRRAMEALK